MYIEASSPRVKGDNAKLELAGVDFNGKKCLSFFYHMYGKEMGSLTVRVGGKSVFNVAGDQGNQWNEAKVQIADNGVLPVRLLQRSLGLCKGD